MITATIVKEHLDTDQLAHLMTTLADVGALCREPTLPQLRIESSTIENWDGQRIHDIEGVHLVVTYCYVYGSGSGVVMSPVVGDEEKP